MNNTSTDERTKAYFSDPRKIKRTINHMMKKFIPGRYFIDCRGHPCVVTEAWVRSEDPYGSEVEGTSLINGTGASCSCMYCGPQPISKETAEEMVEFRKNNTEKDYQIKYFGWTSESYDAFEAEWLKNEGK